MSERTIDKFITFLLNGVNPQRFTPVKSEELRKQLPDAQARLDAADQKRDACVGRPDMSHLDEYTKLEICNETSGLLKEMDIYYPLLANIFLAEFLEGNPRLEYTYEDELHYELGETRYTFYCEKKEIWVDKFAGTTPRGTPVYNSFSADRRSSLFSAAIKKCDR